MVRADWACSEMTVLQIMGSTAEQGGQLLLVLGQHSVEGCVQMLVSLIQVRDTSKICTPGLMLVEYLPGSA